MPATRHMERCETTGKPKLEITHPHTVDKTPPLMNSHFVSQQDNIASLLSSVLSRLPHLQQQLGTTVAEVCDPGHSLAAPVVKLTQIQQLMLGTVSAEMATKMSKAVDKNHIRYAGSMVGPWAPD